MTYVVDYTPQAARQFNDLSREAQVRLKPHIDALAEHPRPPGAKKMVGEENCYRLRVGEYRIVYDAYDEKLWVLVLRAAHRKEVYRGKLRSKAIKEWIEKKLSS